MEQEVLNRSQIIELNVAFAQYVQNNKHLNNAIKHHNQFIRMSDDGLFLKVNIEALSGDYRKKFVDGNFSQYANGLLEKIQPVLTQFLIRFRISSHTFSIHFLFNTMQLIKDLYVVGKRIG